jgi:ABC-type transporter Mla MlaB component
MADARARRIECDVAALAADVGTIGRLARLQLTARRQGCQIDLRNVSNELRDLLAFVGLADVLGVEAGGQPEEREQRLRVEEEGEFDDPSL